MKKVVMVLSLIIFLSAGVFAVSHSANDITSGTFNGNSPFIFSSNTYNKFSVETTGKTGAAYVDSPFPETIFGLKGKSTANFGDVPNAAIIGFRKDTVGGALGYRTGEKIMGIYGIGPGSSMAGYFEKDNNNFAILAYTGWGTTLGNKNIGIYSRGEDIAGYFSKDEDNFAILAYDGWGSRTGEKIGIFAKGRDYAGYFSGDVHITGALTCGSGCGGTGGESLWNSHSNGIYSPENIGIGNTPNSDYKLYVERYTEAGAGYFKYDNNNYAKLALNNYAGYFVGNVEINSGDLTVNGEVKNLRLDEEYAPCPSNGDSCSSTLNGRLKYCQISLVTSHLFICRHIDSHYKWKLLT